jgi:hypothetical protein
LPVSLSFASLAALPAKRIKALAISNSLSSLLRPSNSRSKSSFALFEPVAIADPIALPATAPAGPPTTPPAMGSALPRICKNPFFNNAPAGDFKSLEKPPTALFNNFIPRK